MGQQSHKQQPNSVRKWFWRHHSEVLSAAFALIIIGSIAEILHSLKVLHNPWPTILWIRPFVVSAPLVCIIGGAIIWVLSSLGIIPGPQITILWVRRTIVVFIVFAVGIGSGAAVLRSQGVIPSSWGDIIVIFSTSLTIIVLILSLFMILPFLSPSDQSEKTPSPAAPSDPSSPSAILHVPQGPISMPALSYIVQAPSQSSTSERPTSRGIAGILPPTDSSAILQREQIVIDVYKRLIQPDVTAVALTGLGGIGKSTLVALVYRHVEKLLQTGTCFFTARPLWLTIDASVTMADLMKTLFEAVGIPLPDLSSLAPQNQAAALFNALNTAEKIQLIILDQFEKLLDQTGRALTDRPGVGEWLDALNSYTCSSRVLLTSRLMPQGTRRDPPIHLHKYSVKGLETPEGIELLEKQGVNAPVPELRAAVERCKGHALALTLLASLLRNNRSLTLNVLLEDHTYGYLWTGSIAENLLDRIYTQELDQQQRELLLAFSIYREAVPLEAAQALLEPLLDEGAVPLLTALQGLLNQHLLQAFGERRYQPHAIVAEYARLYFLKGDEQAYRQALCRKRERAAQYYVRQAATTRLPREQRRDISDVHLLIEAFWQYCQAEKWREAYDLLQQEQLFPALRRWGENAVLLDLYQMLLPLENWQQERSEAAGIYRNIASVYNMLGQKEQALMHYEKALDIYKELGDRGEEAAALSELGSLYVAYEDQTKRQHGLKLYEAALHISRELDDRQTEGTILSNIGMVYTALGQKKEARKHYREALSIFREVKENQVKSGRVLNSLGQIYSALGQRERAQKHYEEALHIFRELRDRNGEGITLNNLGKLYDNQWIEDEADQQEKERAGQYYEAAVRIFRELRDREEEGKSAIYLGLFYNGLGKKQEALVYYERALRLFREIGDQWETGTVLTNLGLLHDDMGQKEEALKHYEEALHVHRGVGNHGGEGRTLFSIGILAFELHRYDTALNCFLHARQILEATQSSSLSGIQRWIDALRVEVGEEQFKILLAQVQSVKQLDNFTFQTISSNP